MRNNCKGFFTGGRGMGLGKGLEFGMANLEDIVVSSVEILCE